MSTDLEKTRPPLVFQSRVRAAPEAVFEAFFGEPQRWLCREASVERQLGGRLRLCWPDGCYDGQFVQWVPPTTARFSWRPQGDVLPQTMVVVSIAAVDDQHTAVELEHYGFGVGPGWDALYLGATRAWAGYLKNLRAVLEMGVDLREADE